MQLKMRLHRFIHDCKELNATELIDAAERLLELAEKNGPYKPEELSRQYNEFGRLKTALRLSIKSDEYKQNGNLKAALKMQKRAKDWASGISSDLERFIIMLRRYVDICEDNNNSELINTARQIMDYFNIKQYDGLNKLYARYEGSKELKIALRLSKMRDKYSQKGDLTSADKIQQRINEWILGSHVKVGKKKTKKWNSGWRYVLKMAILVVILPLCFGFFFYFYLEYFLLFIFIIPGILAFLGGALKNGARL